MIGSIHEKGKYFYVVFRHNGKQKWINTNIEAKKGNLKKAKVAGDEIARNYINGVNPNGEMQLTQYLDNWIKKMEGTLKPSTYEDYEKRIYGKLIPYFEPQKLKLKDLKPSTVTEYMLYLKTSGRSDGNGGLSRKSVNNIKVVLSSALEDAVKDKLIKENPVELCKMPSFETDIKKELYVYNVQEVKKLLDYAKETESHIYTFLVLVLFTGMRKGELMALQWLDIDFDNNILLVNKNRTGTKSKTTNKITTPKSESSNRRIPLHPIVVDALKEEKARQNNFKKVMDKAYKGENFVILNSELKPYSNLSAINRVLERLIIGAELPHTTVHGLRHAVATLLDDMGTNIRDISVLLGHSSVYTTEKIYINRIRKAKEESIETIGNAFNNII